MKRSGTRWLWPAIGLAGLFTQACSAPAPGVRRGQVVEPADSLPAVRVTVLRDYGGRVAWSEVVNLIAFDKLGEDGFYDIYVMNPDGSGERCLTSNPRLGVPQKHNGNPSWHPSGKYIVFQAEKEEHPGHSGESTPGFGKHSDLWLVSVDGSEAHQLTNDPAGTDQGVLHPHFSHDGTYLTWSQMYEDANALQLRKTFGYWKLTRARFSLAGPSPTLSNIESFEFGGPAFYENHGLSFDNQYWLYTSNFHAGRLDLLDNDIYITRIADQKSERLTTERYNEHAHFAPNGRKILWMSGADNRNRGTDFWMMNPDGSGKVRLTNFNDQKDPLGKGRQMVCADSAWSPDASRLVGYIQTNLLKQEGMIVMIDLHPDIAKAAAE